MSTMHNSSLQHPSTHLDGGPSITTTTIMNVGLMGKGASPKQLTVLPRKGSRNVYMQKKGLIINNKDLSLAGSGPMGRSPFIPNTDRGYKDESIHPNIKGIGLVTAGSKIDSSSVKKGGAAMSSNHLKGGRNTQNPFTTGQRPDSMISGGRGGSPDNSMMYNHKYNTAEKS